VSTGPTTDERQQRLPRKALVVGVSGISGWNAARHLVRSGWEVHGVSRRAPTGLDGVGHVAVDITDAAAVEAALGGQRFTHVFFCTWSRQESEEENCRVNGGMLRNVLDAVTADGALAHVALVTGLKHYLGPFEAYAKTAIQTPFREEQPRVPYRHFYYDQEDILLELAAARGFTWSVHRAHTMIGWALGNAMNMGVTLAVYAALCREQGRPFVFPGSPQQYDGVTDVTDATLLAEQMLWAATTPEAANEPFNTVNGDVFRWRRMWEVIAGQLGVQTGPYPGQARSLEAEMAGSEAVWQTVVSRHGLQPTELSSLASWWHTDSDLGREVETFADMTKSRRLGFFGFRDTERTFGELFDQLRAARIIP
jgi:nucleoside-diphosphate-sugar epimerase